tara:strand:+ start:172 stop:423 length:252 start_codon:yes stop_codon:yes gene_type:complete
MNKMTPLPAGHALKLVKIGNSTGVILPKELLEKLRVSQGDTIYLSDSPDGVRLTVIDAGFQKKMAVAEGVMREDRDILRVLAK